MLSLCIRIPVCQTNMHLWLQHIFPTFRRAYRRVEEAKVQMALAKRHPDPVALVTSQGKDGKDNIMTIGWFMQTSLNPVLLAISIGRTRFSHSLLADSNEFVLCLPSAMQADAALYCGTHSGRNTDKFAETGLMKIKAKHVRPPLIAGSVACFECKVVDKLQTEDHTIFVGEVLASYSSDAEDVLYDFGGGILRGLK